ncbi:type II toxin-antitoxin system Phd/YefM family antitoxin [Paracoccus sulfuroxidans]|uniref:Antitoxin n=1 Tax=Paracoccus sulfuroxidans TaxID=384678 RepID=A0A562N6X2_9RHOB|nr:type II toxin-antitoxin system prevent-host-death family antitoxin [Paracoccus sulfuroxidans]TWI27942.1 prevent-host-death family protein [Paracoccus sulfuroxidans]
MQIAIAEAKAQFAELIRRVEAGEEVELTRYGRPVARLMAMPQQANRLVGCMKGQFSLPEGLDQPDDQIAALFEDSRLLPE